MTSDEQQFASRNRDMIHRMGADPDVKAATRRWFDRTFPYEYSYHFTWLGRPVIQYPQDLIATQEIVWRVRPDLIIETGIARGGSMIFYASLLELLGNDGRVLGIDVDIRPHNRAAIEEHPLARRIDLLEGSSIAPDVVSQVVARARGKERVLVMLDSHHAHAHVLAELEAYAPLATLGSYVIVFDTVVEDMDPAAYPARPWGRGDNPKTAVHEFLKGNDRFEIDREIHDKLLITVAPDGYLRRVR
jgi:cephalosporin hydroxylase